MDFTQRRPISLSLRIQEEAIALAQESGNIKLEKNFAVKYNLIVTVCHYPPGLSKWNPIEHRLFSEISKNWAGKPLDSYETSINYIKTTKTSAGLTVKAKLVKKNTTKGFKFQTNLMKQLSNTK